jgi:4-amino-4-deoxy-L-arabinose transferase-like glycosyltransferase
MAKNRDRRRRMSSSVEPRPVERHDGRPLAVALMLGAFAVVYATLAVVSYVQKSATWDEPMHLTAGYVALVDGDYRVDPSHPPFLRMWAALPLLFLPSPTIDTSAINRAPGREWFDQSYEFARRFLYVDNDADRLLSAGRFMVVLWGIVLGILLFCWIREWLGLRPALVALVFYTLSPNIAAHASLITTDMGATCFIFGAVYFLWRACRRPRSMNVLGLALFTAVACVTKFSGVVLVPILVCLMAVAVVCRSEISIKTAAVMLGVVAATTFSVVWGIYAFRHAPSESAGWILNFTDAPSVRSQAPILAAVAGWFDAHRILPNAFIQGFVYTHASLQQAPAFLAGNISGGGWWYYFPVAFLIKTPAALIVLFIIGLIGYVRRRDELEIPNELFVVVPMIIYLGFAMTSGINLGIRHVLPIYPFVLLIAAAAAKEMIAARRVLVRIAFAALVAFWLVRFVDAYPRMLTFFNVFVGGSSHGYKYLVDSNLDWGQHLKLLKRWMDERGVSHLNLAYFGTADPAYYGINCTHLPGAPTFAMPSIAKPKLPGYVAISATVLSGVYLPPPWRLFYRGFQERKPVAQVGNSILIYWVDQWPEGSDAVPGKVEDHASLADALMFAQGWTDHAIVHYREYLKHRTDDADAWSRFGLALLVNRQTYEGMSALHEAVRLDPRNVRARRVIAQGLLEQGAVREAGLHAGEAVALAPGDPDAHDVLGVALAMQGRFDEAKAHFERAVQIDPEHAAAAEHLDRIRSANRQ